MDDLDVTFSEHESRLLEMNLAYETLSDRLAELIGARHVRLVRHGECPLPLLCWMLKVVVLFLHLSRIES
jgi:hypothetical protein